MVNNIKNLEELKNLIQQAKDGEIPLDTKVKLESSIEVSKPIQKVSLEN
jgi:hypothetical protein